MSTDLVRHALNGPTMGTRWSALFHMPPGIDTASVRLALQAAVDQVDDQMSTWKPDSALMRLNATALDIGRASDGAFDIGVGDAVAAWGFGPTMADQSAMRAALVTKRLPAHDLLQLDTHHCRACKQGHQRLDLCGIAKGYGVDRLAEVAVAHGIPAALVAIDGEVRAIGTQPGGTPWVIAVERPDPLARAAHAVLALQDAAVATSGDYRHWVAVGNRRLSHTIDPARGAPLAACPASVTVVAATCMAADAWATALMVRGSQNGAALARRHGLNALFLDRDGDRLVETRVGPLFDADPPLHARHPANVALG